MRSMALAEEVTTVEDTPEEARRLLEITVDLAAEGHNLALQLVQYNDAEVTLKDIKHALPTCEAIAVFFNVIYDEYTPEGIKDPTKAAKAASKGDKETTRTTKGGKKSRPKK